MSAEIMDAPVKSSRGRAAEIPLLVKMKARNLYFVDNLGWEEIGERCGWSAKALAQCAQRELWTAEKKRRKSALIAKADAHMNAVQNEVIEAIASKSEEAALKAMANVDKALDRSDEFAAKDFQAYTAGVKNLASTARLLREPAKADLSGEGARSVNIFFMPANSPISSEPKTVQAIDVKAVEVDKAVN